MGHEAGKKGRRWPVSISPSFPLMLSLMLCVGGSDTVLPFFLAAAVHEAGHLTVLQLLRIPVEGLELRASGAVIRAELRGQLREAWAVLAGPGANFLLSVVCRRLWPELSVCSTLLLCYNLLPVGGLDGGRLCRLVLPGLFGSFGLFCCKALHWCTAAMILAAGVWGTCVLHLGLLPVLFSAFFLLRLPNLLDKAPQSW